MLLAIDVGNTNIVVALYEGENVRRTWRMATDRGKASDEIGMMFMQFLTHENISPGQIDGIIIASVVPTLMHALKGACRRYIGKEPIIVEADLIRDMNIKLDNLKELGADRLVNAVSAINKYGAPLIVVDFGTATTFCAIDERRNYLGGVICAGIKISMDALFERAAKLPKVELVAPEKIIGASTIEAMQSGALFGHAAQVDGIVRRMRKELGGKAQVIATGGFAKMIKGASEEINIVDSTLTLDGLKIIYDEIGGDNNGLQ